ncbi:hypothetical protein GCM10010437_053660 [Actinoplanes palleronii]
MGAERSRSARVLGRPAILGPDGAPVRGLRTKALEPFVYLVLNRDGAALGDIMEALWRDITLQRATDRLEDVDAIHDRLERLRGALAEAGLPARSDTEQFAADLLRRAPATCGDRPCRRRTSGLSRMA